MKKFRVFVVKEFRHIFRDKRTMLILLAMPVVMIILFGYAITTEVRNTRVVVVDHVKDQTTLQISDRIAHNAYFTLVAQAANTAEGEQKLMDGSADMVVVFSPGFSSDLRHTGRAEIQLLADGSEPNQAAVRTGYMQNILASFMQDAQSGSVTSRPHIEVVTRMLYNPQSKSEYNFVPAVIGLILLLICAMMTSIAIVREKETGTIEVLLASPLPPIVIVLAKLVPYFVISCVNLTTILLLSTVFLHIPIAGSLPGFVAVTLLYILVALLLGLLISTCVASQLAAMLLSLLLIIPSVYLSGLAFPIESMPGVFQGISAIVPARWYVDVARRVMIQGTPMHYVVPDILVLVLMAVVLLAVSWRKFKIRLE
ncbi:MAG: ABC transporter permease [Alloprevotella sp.]